MRPAFTAQSQPGRGASEEKFGAAIGGIGERIEATRHKGIVDRANRQEPLAKQRMAETGRSPPITRLLKGQE